jgi:hypothetical protein
MYSHALLVPAVVVALGAAVHAQEDESAFNQKQADRLNKFAKSAFDKGFPRQARLIWMQVIKLYDVDNAAARKAIGHVRVGASWAPDSTIEYPITDTGNGNDGTALFRAYEKLKSDLATAHRNQAKIWDKAGRKDRSEHHYRMVLRWVKSDAEAQKALDHKDLGGVTGTSLEQTLFERSKAIEKAVEEQSHVDYPIEKTDSKAPPLDRAQVAYVSLKSEHFTLRGDPDQEEFLEQALVWAERTLAVCSTAFPWKAKVGGEWAYFTGKDTYKQILRAHADRIPDLEWKLEHTATSGIGGMVVGATGSTQTLFDACVRNVAQSYAGFGSDGLREGIGHTFVGMMFNSNRLFSVDLKKQEGTTATEEDREYTSPDFDVWKTLALEMAWKMSGGVPALDLPYCDAASFSNEQRIKAWSFCDYVMRRDPELLRKFDLLGLEQTQAKKKLPLEFAEKFEKEAGVSVAQLDREWEDFWTEATPALAAIRNNTPPLSAISKGVEKWLAALNEARAASKAAPVTWSSQLSARCREHAEYLANNKPERGPAAEHRQKIDFGGSHLGSMFAQMAVVEVSAKIGDAKKMFERWLSIPGYRDLLVHDFQRSVGIYTQGDILVINTAAGLGQPLSRGAGYLCFPWKDATGIPDEVEVASIGPELEALLEKHGKGGRKVVGFPMTIHFGSAVQGDPTSYRCVLTDAKGEKVEGAILSDSGTIRRSTAPGMVTFYPFDPLPRGKLNATWSWEVDGAARTLSASFSTK